jgi:hypothetical protein
MAVLQLRPLRPQPGHGQARQRLRQQLAEAHQAQPEHGPAMSAIW